MVARRRSCKCCRLREVASYASAKEIVDPTAAHYKEEAQREPPAITGRVSGDFSPPHDPNVAVEIPLRVKEHLGLDSERSWVKS